MYIRCCTQNDNISFYLGVKELHFLQKQTKNPSLKTLCIIIKAETLVAYKYVYKYVPLVGAVNNLGAGNW